MQKFVLKIRFKGGTFNTIYNKHYLVTKGIDISYLIFFSSP